MKEKVREEMVYDTQSSMQQYTEHTVRDLPPFTNVSLRLILSNPEGRKESKELLVLTDEDGTTLHHSHTPGRLSVNSREKVDSAWSLLS